MKYKSCGFSLVELVVAFAMVAILAAIALPDFHDLMVVNRLRTQTHRFINAMNMARSAAIKENRYVFVCPRQGGHCSGNHDWTTGWLIFTDRNGNSQMENDEKIQVFEELRKGFSMGSNVNVNMLVFSPMGEIRRKSGALAMMTFRICAKGANLANMRERSREIVINAAGRMRVQFGKPGKTRC